ncbi:MAG: hypothetical protein ACFFF9_10020 [Candidatus Thorarchaeota archaeon]
MRTAQLVGIKEEELYAFIDVLPSLWERERNLLESSMNLILRKHYECQSSVFGIYLYNMNLILLALLVSYERETGLASIEVSAFSGGVIIPTYEERIRNILLDVTEKDLVALTSDAKESPIGLFICPYCGAQYVNRVLRRNEEGETECQNCGRFVKTYSW